METVLPAFIQFPQEGAIVGRLLAGYGELEMDLCSCATTALNDKLKPLRAMFRSRGEKQRIGVADALMRDFYRDISLEIEYVQMLEAIDECRKIRNQYAHCHWAAELGAGLFFTNMEDAARKTSDNPMLTVHHISTEILQEQESYFIYAQTCATYLSSEGEVLMNRIQAHPWLMPDKREKPPRYSPPGTYKPLATAPSQD